MHQRRRTDSEKVAFVPAEYLQNKGPQFVSKTVKCGQIVNARRLGAVFDGEVQLLMWLLITKGRQEKSPSQNLLFQPMQWYRSFQLAARSDYPHRLSGYNSWQITIRYTHALFSTWYDSAPGTDKKSLRDVPHNKCEITVFIREG